MGQIENPERKNENSTPQVDMLSDLRLTDDQADRATGGIGATGNQGKLIVG
jgi:hypothetical protein